MEGGDEEKQGTINEEDNTVFKYKVMMLGRIISFL